MDNSNFTNLQNLLNEKAEINSRLTLITYDGTPEIKERDGKKYLYIRKRIAGRLTSTYVGIYSDELYRILLADSQTARQLKKRLRRIDSELASLGYEQLDLTSDVMRNIDFARANLKENIYDQAVLEGVGTTFPQTEEILENGIVNGVAATDVQKILNLKHAWEFILDADVVQNETNFTILSYIAKLVNEGLYYGGDRVRSVPVTIGGSSYVPPVPIEQVVVENIDEITAETGSAEDTAIKICLYVMKTQVFLDGNKRTAVIFANHYMIGHGAGLLIIPEKEVSGFKNLLIDFYEGEDIAVITQFLKDKCIRRI